MNKRKRKIALIAFAAFVLMIAGVIWWNSGSTRSNQLPVPSNLFGQLNTEVPDAKNKKHDGWNKLDYYRQADADSAKRKAEQARDPYYVLPPIDSSAADQQAAVLDQQLHVLQRQLNVPAKKPVIKSVQPERISPEVEKLETMMQQLKRRPGEPDPEMQQLGDMLDKLNRLQHRGADVKTNDEGVAYAATTPGDSIIKCIGDPVALASENKFYSLSDERPLVPHENAFVAIIPANQTLTSGGVIRLLLLQGMQVNNLTIPAQHFIYGVAQLNNERLLVRVSSIRVGQQIIPVKMSVYDTDGLAGIYIPGAITREVAKQSAGRSLSQVDVGTFNPSVGAQAATAGIQAAKTLLQRKAQLVRVTVPAGYRVFLQNQ